MIGAVEPGLLAWRPHFDVWIALGAFAGSYFFVLAHLGPKFSPPDKPSATRAQKVLFLSGVAVLWVGADWPIHDISENYLYSAHMLQHLLFSLVAPPLLLLGTPEWMPRALLGSGSVFMRVAQKATRPLFALLIFNAYVALTHWPVFIELTLRSGPLHMAAHIALVGASLVMWMPVFSPTPDFPRITYPAQMLYLFLQSVLPTVPASFFTFAEGPLIAFYEQAPRLFPSVDVVVDQRLAGLVMKTIGGFVLWGYIATIFFKWYSVEHGEATGVTTGPGGGDERTPESAHSEEGKTPTGAGRGADGSEPDRGAPTEVEPVTERPAARVLEKVGSR